jgi:hypothetical protein
VTWTIADHCYTSTTYSRTFTITAPAPVVVTPAANSTTSACTYANQAAADAAFAAWLTTASVSGGCSPTSTPDITTGPAYCGGAVTVTWTIADHCYTSTTYSRTFTITGVTTPIFDNCEDGTTPLGCNPTPPSCDASVTASNECGNVPVTCTPGTITNVGTCGRQQIFDYSATACGLTSHCSRTYTWTVSTAPVFANCNNTIPLGSNPPTLPTCANYANLPGGAVIASNECGSVTVTCNAGTVTNSGCNRSQVFTFTATACGFTSTCTRTYTWTVTCGHIFPTATTCCNYTSGNTPTLDNLCYKYSNGNTRKVTNAIPGVMFYYGTVTAPGTGPFVIDVIQTKNVSTFNYLNIQNTANMRLFTATCGTNISYTASTLSNLGHDAHFVVTGYTPGATYIVSVKYDVKSMLGSTFTGSAPAVTYTYECKVNGTPVSGQTGTIDALANCQDNTPAPPSCTLPAAPSVPANDLITARSITEDAVTISKEGVSVTAYPNPFEDNIRFSINSDISGQATLEVYSLLGVKLQTVYTGFVFAGKGQTINYQVPGLYRTTLIYKLRVGGKTVTGKLINVK